MTRLLVQRRLNHPPRQPITPRHDLVLALSARFARLRSEDAEAMTKLREWKAEQEKLPLSLWLLWTAVWLLIVGVLAGIAYLLYLWMQ